MTTSGGARDRRQVGRQHIEPAKDVEPTDIESLLPWYAAGTLHRRDRRRVEEALRTDHNLARQADLAREELAETICLNETLGAPSARVMERLMAAIEAEALAARRRGFVRTLAGRFTGFMGGFSPRTLAVAASLATLAIVVQAVMLVGLVSKPQGPVQTAAVAGRLHLHGTFALVRFARQASAAEITKFLQHYKATLVDGPRPDGLYRVRLSMTALAGDELGRIASQLQQEPVVESVQFTAPGEAAAKKTLPAD